MITLPEKVIADIRAHAEREYPRECCGLVIVKRGKSHYAPCRNTAENDMHFVIHPEDQAAAEDSGTIQMVVHSHPNISPKPSQADMVWCERSGVPWLIINWPTGVMRQFEPSGYVLPLTGRVYVDGAIDCYELVADYYRQILNIAMPTPIRGGKWWLKGENLYLDNYAAAGFEVVDAPQKHDVLLMQVASPVPNHGAVFLGDGTILHHQMGRLSSRDQYGGWYRKITTHIMRHREVKQ